MPTALISGASTGIGQATTLRLARAGWTVFAGVRDQAASERLQADANGISGRVLPVTLDVTDPAQIAQVAERIARETGGADGPGSLDALVNNAGVGYGGPLELLPIDDLRMQLEVNVIGQVAVTQALLPALRAAHGRVVFISSIGGRVAMAYTAPYAASKHAIEAIGDALRVELRTSDVQVALMEPGSVATPIWDKGRSEAERLSIPPQLQPQYGHVREPMAKALQGAAQRGIPAEQVAETIERALTAKRMRARYLIGSDAKAMLAIRRLLPDRWFDRFARRALGV